MIASVIALIAMRPTTVSPQRFLDIVSASRHGSRLDRQTPAFNVLGSMTGFEQALTFTLSWEGGFVNHPADPGGATNLGVTQATYDAWRKSRGQSRRSVKLIGRDEASAIYRAQYWDALGCDRLHRAVALVVFDTAVNFGVGRARAFLRMVQGDTPTSGTLIDLLRLGRAQFPADAAAVAFQVVGMRKAWRYQRVLERPDQSVFLKGWIRRDNAVEAEARVILGVMPA